VSAAKAAGGPAQRRPPLATPPSSTPTAATTATPTRTRLCNLHIHTRVTCRLCSLHIHTRVTCHVSPNASNPTSIPLPRRSYKGIWVCLLALARALSGSYVNFGVFELYGDPALKVQVQQQQHNNTSTLQQQHDCVVSDGIASKGGAYRARKGSVVVHACGRAAGSTHSRCVWLGLASIAQTLLLTALCRHTCIVVVVVVVVACL
jgi:hypothetical protein